MLGRVWARDYKDSKRNCQSFATMCHSMSYWIVRGNRREGLCAREDGLTHAQTNGGSFVKQADVYGFILVFR
jgi:hypothetical protein